MPENRVILATTQVIDGVMMTRECLVDATTQINGEKALRQTVEHDPCSVPLGKVRAAEVVDIGVNAELVAIPDETHKTTASIHEPSGTRIVEITYPNDSRPFVLFPAGKTNADIAIAVDPANFDRWEALEEFQDTDELGGANEATSVVLRRSLTPEPFIEFQIHHLAIAYALYWVFRRGEKFLRYTVDQTARKAGDEISDAISARLRAWLAKFNQHRSPDEREVTSQIIINSDPQIILITKGENTEQNTEVGIKSLTKQLELWQVLLETSDSITFARESKDEEWKFIHMATSEGKVKVDPEIRTGG